MDYRITRNDLGNEALAQTLEALAQAFCEIGAPLYVVGAVARDLSLKMLGTGDSPRRTMDLDVGVMLGEWSEFETLSGILVRRGFEKAPEKQRFHYLPPSGFRYEVDIVPFGQIAENDMVAWPPEGNPVMSVRCFSDIMEHADLITVDGSFQFRVAPLSGQWLIKFDAWYDRHAKTGKDAADMQFILENAYVCFAIASDSLPEEVSTEAASFDLTVAGAEWIASDLRRMLPESKRKVYAKLLEDELARSEESALIGDLYDRAKTSSFDSIERAVARMVTILSGALAYSSPSISS